MKMLLLPLFVLLLTSSIWIGATAQSIDDIDLSDVVIIDDVAPAPDSAADSEATLEREERPDPVIELELPNIAAPEIPVATQALPDEAEIVLEIPGQEVLSIGQASMASEETISVDFPDEEVRTILRNVADLFEINLVIPDTLQGRTSIKLRNVSWRQVFEVVLEPLGFTYIEDRNIIRIRSIDDLTTEPVDTRVFVVNYARAEEIQGSIAPLVDSAAGGQIKVDVRSNALVITERPSRMNKIQEIIERLDKPTHQVMIESKFVEVTQDDVKNIGVDWTSLSGYGLSAGPFTRAWERERSRETGLKVEDADGNGFSLDNGPLFDNFETSSDTFSNLASTSRIDSAVFSADQFDLILRALKTNNDIKLVSNPTVVTLDNKLAKIAIGEKFPIPRYSFNAETGERQLDGINYEDIGITLDVTPQVNSAGFINLSIIPEVSSRLGVAIVESTEIPIIASRRTETNIMIKDGFTLAIGGLSENETSTQSSRVPFLGDLPGLGRLFRSSTDRIEQRNLIIFITARTLNPDGSTYRDIIDPRVLESMEITSQDIPGYQLTPEHKALLDELETYRNEAVVRQQLDVARSRIEEVEQARAGAEVNPADKSK